MATERWAAYDDLAERRSARATKSDMRLLKGQARKNDDLAETAYREGIKEAKYQQREKARAKKARLQARKRKYPVARKVAGKVRQPVSAGCRLGAPCRPLARRRCFVSVSRERHGS